MDLFGKFKLAEQEFDASVQPKNIYAIRIDGNSFKSYTKGLVRPFDVDFMDAMDSAAMRLCEEISGAMFAYVQSDEITIFLSDLRTPKSQLWFGGRINKWLSVTASIASVVLSRAFPAKEIPAFDARVLQLDDMQSVEYYLDWRSRDAYKNSITMAASCHYSHRELDSKTTNDRIAMLHDTEHSEELLPLGFRYGRVIARKYVPPVDVTDVLASRAPRRGQWVIAPATVDVVVLVVERIKSELVTEAG